MGWLGDLTGSTYLKELEGITDPQARIDYMMNMQKTHPRQYTANFPDFSRHLVMAQAQVKAEQSSLRISQLTKQARDDMLAKPSQQAMRSRAQRKSQFGFASTFDLGALSRGFGG